MANEFLHLILARQNDAFDLMQVAKRMKYANIVIIMFHLTRHWREVTLLRKLIP
jgi:hypothetical protein